MNKLRSKEKFQWLFLRSRATLSSILSYFYERRKQWSSSKELCCLNASSKFYKTTFVVSCYFVFFICSPSSLTLSEMSFIMTIILFFPSTSTLFFVNTTVRQWLQSLPFFSGNLILNAVDLQSKVWKASVRVSTFSPSSVSPILLPSSFSKS